MLFFWTFAFKILIYDTSCYSLFRACQAIFEDYWSFVGSPIIGETDAPIGCGVSHEGLSQLCSLQRFSLQSLGLGFAEVASVRGINV